MNGPFLLSEAALTALEAQIPAMAERAFAQAELHALATGGKVLKARAGKVVEINAEGQERVIKEIAPPVRVPAGSRWVLPAARE